MLYNVGLGFKYPTIILLLLSTQKVTGEGILILIISAHIVKPSIYYVI